MDIELEQCGTAPRHHALGKPLEYEHGITHAVLCVQVCQ